MEPTSPASVAPGDTSAAIVADSRQLAHELAAHHQRPDLAEESDAVVAIVESLSDDPTLLGAAALCGVVREQLLSQEQIRKRLGNDLAAFSSQLARLDQLTPHRNWEDGSDTAPEQAEALRRMLMAIVNDIRLILVRLAEVLYRLRQAKRASPDSQRALAREVLGLYAPLANRLGVWQLKWELEDLSFRYLHPDTYKELATRLNTKRRERERYLDEVKGVLGRELGAAGIRADISARPKHIYSIWRKMKRKNASIDAIFDLRAVRIIVDDIRDCYAALGIVHNLWSYLPQEFDDYIAHPKGNYYRSLHTAVIGPGNEPLEVQIRTPEMHRHAELGVAAHWRYKEGGNAAPAFEQKIRWLRQLLEPGSEGGSSDFLAQVREDILEDRVYAISPKGDIVDLPAGSTPLDFAYQVHTEIGHRCRGAKVNGRIVPLTYAIENGDRIEIITARESAPSRDWLLPRLGYLASGRSRAKVRAWFRQQDRDQNRKQGREILEREMQRLNLRDISAKDIARQLKFVDSDALYVALGASDVTPAAIATAAQHLQPPEDVAPRIRARRPQRHDTADARVQGIGDLLSQFARCCRPVPPDPIVAYITQGRGVTIHRADCGNVRRLTEQDERRILDVEWGESGDRRYEAELRIEAMDRAGLLRDISAVLSDENISINASNSRVDRASQTALIQLTVEVNELATLSRALNRIAALPSVLKVQRA